MTNLKFNIEYKTQWGEELAVVGNMPQLGSLDVNNAMLLVTTNGVNWSGQVQVPISDKHPLEYYYIVCKNKQLLRKENSPQRTIMLCDNSEFIINDSWKDNPSHTYLYTSVFTDCVFWQPLKPLAAPKKNNSLLLNVTCPYVKKSEHLLIAGEGNILGHWDIKKALPLSQTRFGEWQIELNASDFTTQLSYKFAIVDKTDYTKVHWEEGNNRTIRVSEPTQANKTVHVEMTFPYRYASFQWKGKGVSIPLFSLRTEDSAGIGEYTDLKKMVDWSVATGQDMIQILPINDTTSTKNWTDSYPYNSISIFALNPIYLSIRRYKFQNKLKLTKLRAQAKELNELAVIDYEKVYALKQIFFRELFSDHGQEVIQSEAYIDFYIKNEEWLFPYAWFCHLRDKYHTADFRQWDVYSTYRKDFLQSIMKTDIVVKNEVEFYIYLQFLAFMQLNESKKYAQKMGVALKGDIPIGINSNSVEAWTEPHLFNLEMQAGAPPDDFSVSGQNWGFPTYNWKEMQRDNYEWWKKRFRKMADYSDAYRIDHILGFFRIWEMSSHHVQGLLGHFSPAMPLSKEEMYYSNFPFHPQRMAQPYIHECMLQDFFGDYVAEVASDYLDVLSWQRFCLKPFCNTQRKIEQLFADKTDQKSNTLRNGLYSLCAEVLFVPDPYTNDRFHPRISAQNTYSYKHLNDYEKEAFNCIYYDFFYKRHNSFWYDQAMSKLPQLISATSMLVCGEDLGMVPDCVNWVMDELRILSLEIQRMPKERNRLFSDLNRLPYLSVNTTSTHDMSTIRGWWLENRENTQYYYNNILGGEGQAPVACSAQICEQIICQHLASNSMWSILPWQDWMSIDGTLRRENPEEERINVPSDPKHYWRYRMHITIEELLNEKEFNQRVKMLQR